MTMKEKLTEIANHYGYDAQARQLVEEMAELTVAINKEWRSERGMMSRGDLRDNIVEEIADVEVMLDQMKLLLNCDGAVFIEKMRKVDRQMERMKNSKTPFDIIRERMKNSEESV